MITRKKICKRCNTEFNTKFPEAEYCNSCLRNY